MKLRFVAVAAAICITAGSFLYPTSPLCPSSDTAYAKTLSEIDKEKKDKQNEISAKKAELAKLQDNIEAKEKYQQTLNEEIELINYKMLLIDSQLNSLVADIDAKQTEINELELQIGDQENKIAQGLSDFKTRIRTLYIHGNDSLLSALVGATDFYDVLAKVDLINRVAKHDDTMVEELSAELAALSKNKDDLNARMQALNVKITETEAIRQEFNESREELDAAMAQTEEVKMQLEADKNKSAAELSQYQKEYDQLEAERDRIAQEEMRKEQERLRKEAEKKAAEEAAKKKKQTTAPPSSGGAHGTTVATKPVTTSPPKYTGGKLAWPVPGFYHISSPFGPRWGSFHRGIDIAGGGIHNTNVKAAGSGSVCLVKGGCSHDYAGNCGCNYGYGNYVVVNHGNGLYTLYAHLASINVSVGQSVSTSTTIGHVGSTGHSTGYHLHFGVGVGGYSSSNFVNPMNYLQ